MNLDDDLEISNERPKGPANNQEKPAGKKEKEPAKEGFDKFTPAAIRTLLGSWLVHTVVGSQYAWGSISPYIVSYFRNQGVDATEGQFYAVLPLIVVVSTLVFPFGMQLSSKLGSRKVIFLGGLVLVAVTLITSWLLYVLLFFLVWACGFGVAKGALYPAPLRASWSHLPGRKGLVTGIIVSGLGFGSFIYGIVVN